MYHAHSDRRFELNSPFICSQAGLFSAVLTAFTTVSYKDLQPSPSAETNMVLKGILHQLNNSLEPSSLGISKVHDHDFSPPHAAIWLNVLWFSSLTCSLLAAFGAVLAKQWMVEYPRGVASSATPYERAQHRQICYAGLFVWKFQTIIKIFPILIQIAFILFFIGLCQFLFMLHSSIGWTVTILCIIGLLFLLFSSISAVVYTNCPYRTPFSSSLGALVTMMKSQCAVLIFGPPGERHNLWRHPRGCRGSVIKAWKQIRYGNPHREGHLPHWAAKPVISDHNEHLDDVNAGALAWLISSASKEEIVISSSHILPTLPATDIQAPLRNALPRLCIMFQSHFMTDGKFGNLCPRIIPKPKKEGEIKILGQAIHRIMLCQPCPLAVENSTQILGDVFGDSYQVFPPRDIDVDVHTLVNCLVVSDPSFYARYSLGVQEQLFHSLLNAVSRSPWAITMILDSLCIYLSYSPQNFQVSPTFRSTILSHISQVLQQPASLDSSSAMGLTVKVILEEALDMKILALDRMENVSQNILLGVEALVKRLLNGGGDSVHIGRDIMEDCLSVLLNALQELTLDKSLKKQFLGIWKNMMRLLCSFLIHANCPSTFTIARVIGVINAYEDQSLPVSLSDVPKMLSMSVAQLHHTGSDSDFISALQLIGRLIIVEQLAPLPPIANSDMICQSLVDIIKHTRTDNLQLAVIQSLASYAKFWFECSGLLHDLEAAGIHNAVMHFLSSPQPAGDFISVLSSSREEKKIYLALIIADHLAPLSAIQLFRADPELLALKTTLKSNKLQFDTHQQCGTVILQILSHLSSDHITQVLEQPEFLVQLKEILLSDNNIEKYMVECWCKMSKKIAETHIKELFKYGYLTALKQVARMHHCELLVEWIPDSFNT
jgi:Family of unknown function (DUF6535)